MNGLMTTDEVCEAFIRAGDAVADGSCIPRPVFWERLYEALADRDGHIHAEPGASLADMQTDEPACSTCGFIPLKSAIARHYCSCYAPSGVTA